MWWHAVGPTTAATRAQDCLGRFQRRAAQGSRGARERGQIPREWIPARNPDKIFPHQLLPYQGEAIKEEFEGIKEDFSPELILTHYRDDRHQDHRLISDLTWNTFRSHLILEYEIPKYDGDVGCPNVFVQLADDIAAQKVTQLMRHFQTQKNKHWFTPDLFQAMMRIRGMECGARYAEAFYARKLALGADIRPTSDDVTSAARETASRPPSHALPVFT
jgi:LmbE family N-acetylglucosaminyl deacetylase